MIEVVNAKELSKSQYFNNSFVWHSKFDIGDAKNL